MPNSDSIPAFFQGCHVHTASSGPGSYSTSGPVGDTTLRVGSSKHTLGHYSRLYEVASANHVFYTDMSPNVSRWLQG